METCVGAIAIVGSVQYVSAAPDKHSLAALKDTAREISKSLTHRDTSASAASARAFKARQSGKA
jgi:hypothetical protein